MSEKISLNDPQRLSILCQTKTNRGKRSLSDVGALAIDPTRIPDPILREDALEDDEQAESPMDIDDFSIRGKRTVVQSAHNNSSDRRAVTRKSLLTK